MLITGINNSFEKNIKASLFFTFGIDVMSLKFNYITSAGNSAFSNNYFVALPVTIKKYYKVSNKSDIFLNFGVAPAYYISSKDYIENGKSTINKSLGVNIGGVAGFGFKIPLSKKLYFDIGLNSFQDFIYSYTDKADKLTIKSNSIMISFYWHLK